MMLGQMKRILGGLVIPGLAHLSGRSRLPLVLAAERDAGMTSYPWGMGP